MNTAPTAVTGFIPADELGAILEDAIADIADDVERYTTANVILDDLHAAGEITMNRLQRAHFAQKAAAQARR